MLRTNVGSKGFVTLSLVVPLHFIEWIANNCARRLEPPVARRATESLKFLLIKPHQTARHCSSIRLE